eukprot:scaffold84992_cov17-Tisochrysis_lutea.AAC.2
MGRAPDFGVCSGMCIRLAKCMVCHIACCKDGLSCMSTQGGRATPGQTTLHALFKIKEILGTSNLLKIAKTPPCECCQQLTNCAV